MARDKNEQRISRKQGKGGGTSAQANPGFEAPIDNIFRNRNEEGLDDPDDENPEYNFRMDGGPAAGTTGGCVGTRKTRRRAAPQARQQRVRTAPR